MPTNNDKGAQNNTIYNTIQYNTIEYHTILYNAIQYHNNATIKICISTNEKTYM